MFNCVKYVFFGESDLSSTNFGADVVITCVLCFFSWKYHRQHGFHSSHFLWVTLEKMSALMGEKHPSTCLDLAHEKDEPGM